MAIVDLEVYRSLCRVKKPFYKPLEDSSLFGGESIFCREADTWKRLEHEDQWELCIYETNDGSDAVVMRLNMSRKSLVKLWINAVTLLCLSIALLHSARLTSPYSLACLGALFLFSRSVLGACVRVSVTVIPKVGLFVERDFIGFAFLFSPFTLRYTTRGKSIPLETLRDVLLLESLHRLRAVTYLAIAVEGESELFLPYEV